MEPRLVSERHNLYARIYPRCLALRSKAAGISSYERKVQAFRRGIVLVSDYCLALRSKAAGISSCERKV
jgi:hypothetical protein